MNAANLTTMTDKPWITSRCDGVLILDPDAIADDRSDTSEEQLQRLHAEASRLSEAIRADFQRQMAQFATNSARYLEQAIATWKGLAARGWYLDFTLTMRQLMGVLSVFESGRESDADRMLADHYGRCAGRFCEEIRGEFPQRAERLGTRNALSPSPTLPPAPRRAPRWRPLGAIGTRQCDLHARCVPRAPGGSGLSRLTRVERWGSASPRGSHTV